MSKAIIANRYAQALMDLSKNDASKAKAKLSLLTTVAELFELEESRKILVSPIMPVVLKKQLLEYALGKAGSDQELSHFLSIVVEAGRVSIIPNIVESFAEMINEMEGKVNIKIQAASEMDQETSEAVFNALKQAVKADLSVCVDVHPELLGGFVVNMGNRRLDLSLKSRLDEISANAVV